VVFSSRRRVLRPCNCHESARVPFYRTGFHLAIRGVNSFQCRYAWKHTEIPMRFPIVAPTTWRSTLENDRRQKGRLLRPHSDMMAITQRNLVFAHVTSMRPIEILRHTARLPAVPLRISATKRTCRKHWTSSQGRSVVSMERKANVRSPRAGAGRSRVTSRQVLPCRKTHLAPYAKPEKALSLKVDDIDRTQLLVWRAHVGSCPQFGAPPVRGH
jgi:hypothetical protein